MAEALLASRSAGYLPRALALIDEWLEDHPPTLAGWWAWVEDGADDRSPYTLSQYTAMMRTAAEYHYWEGWCVCLGVGEHRGVP